MHRFNQKRWEQKDGRPLFSISFLVEFHGEKYMESQTLSEIWKLG